jgi:osmotically-inducible protein OsmY
MSTSSTAWRGWLGVAIICTALGCATSERNAAKRLDMTPAIVQEASNLLAADQELSRYPIVVDGFRGNMRLKGQVTTPAQKARAEKLLWAVRGVKSVENDLQLNPAARR